MKFFSFDIETNGLLDERLVDYSSFPYKLKPQAVTHCAWIQDVFTKEMWGYRPHEIKAFIAKLQEADAIISYNGINFDHLFLRLEHGATYEISEDPDVMDTFMGKPVRIIDLLVMSKVANPDRFKAHSLKNWGKLLNNFKGTFGEDEEPEATWEKFSEDMFDYNKQDVVLTTDVFHYLVKEMAGTVTENFMESAEWKKYWSKAFHLEQAIKELITRQSHFGFAFDEKKAKDTVTDLNRLLKECEDEAEPHLPERVMAASKQPKFPAKPFKMNGELSSTGLKWIEKLGLSEAPLEEQLQAIREKRMVKLTEPMKLSSTEDVKRHLVGLGWRPTKWGERDLFVESDKKTPSTWEQFQKRTIAYIQKTVETPLEEFRVSKLDFRKRGADEDVIAYKNALYRHMASLWMAKDNGGARKLMAFTLPKFTVDMDKNMCPNLEMMAEEIPYSKSIVYWLTYRHRRNSVQSPNGTGYLSQVRADGRIPTPADSCGCNTARMKHKIVCNIPRVTSLYGKPMRELFQAGNGYYQVGTDGDAIEARIQGHFVTPFKGGEEEAKLLLASKPFDVHTVTAKAMNIDRDQAKTERYAMTYGASYLSRAIANGWDKKYAKKVFDDFWEFNKATKAYKDELEREWKRNNKKWIKGVDGRKLSTRSQHALLNVSFQSAGVICMKVAHIYADRTSKAEGYCVDPFEGKPTAMFMCCYHDESAHAVDKNDFTFKMVNFDPNVKGDEDRAEKEIKEIKAKLEAEEGRRWSDVNHTDKCYYIAYSRAGEITSEALEYSGKHFNLRASITGGYQVGTSWASTH